MSLLDRGRDDIIIYPEITWTDADGNIMSGADFDNPIEARATIQPTASSGTSARRAEQNQEGFETEQNYRMRLPRSFPFVINAQAQIEWMGELWSINGDAYHYNGSSRTAHIDYEIRRT